jgi:sulfur carrier protein
MRLIVNGEIYETSKAGNVEELLREFRIEPVRVAVEVNMSVIKKSDYGIHTLNDGDKVEIVNFVGGGCR